MKTTLKKPARVARSLQAPVRTQWWLAEVGMYGTPKLADGPHSNREGPEKALTILQRLGLSSGRQFEIAEVRLTQPTGVHGPLNEGAIKQLNKIGLRPNTQLDRRSEASER